jgi:glycosyltransferase involved in cell wall biosynthesis
MNVIQVVAGLDPRGGGPSYSVPRLARALAGAGLVQSTLCVGNPAKMAEGETQSYSQIFRGLPVLGSLRLSPALRSALFARAQLADLLHVHGLWLMPNVYAGWAARHANRPLIVSPRGMLAPAALSFSRAKKALFWHLLQAPAYAKATAWHATSEEEAEDVREFGVRVPIAVIPNGIDLPQLVAPHADSADSRVILFLSRLHPKKNIPVLLEAWRRIAHDIPEWRLVIAGPDEGGHRADLEAQVAHASVPRVEFLDPLYGADKDALIASADLFVLPTLSENFGIAVAEALAAGVPAIVTKGAPWAGLEPERTGWWIDHGAEPLAAAMRQATALPPAERRAMGTRARAWMARDFGWAEIARDMASVYSWALGKGERPACVRSD